MNPRTLQTQLATLGYSAGPIDGKPGKRTEAATVAFQLAAGLYPDGIAGPKIEKALAAALAALKATAPSAAPSA